MNQAQRSFAAGELSPLLYARTDTTKYGAGLRQCRNFQVLRQGGASNRPGTRYINTASLGGAHPVRIVPFVFSLDLGQTYVLEIGHFYTRIYLLGVLQGPGTPAAWSNVTNYAVGDLVSYLGINYWCRTSNSNQQPNLSGDWYAMPAGILELPTPWNSADVGALYYAQQADVMTLTHPNYQPIQISRRSATQWAMGGIAFTPTQPAPTTPSLTGGDCPPWDSTKAYIFGDFANNGGANYVCIKAHTNQAPPNTTYWAIAPFYEFVITALDPITDEESLPSVAQGKNGQGSAASPFVLSWTAIPGVQEYNVYRTTPGPITSGIPQAAGVHGFVGTATTNSFSDAGIVADNSVQPPIGKTPFPGAGDWPAIVSAYQERAVYAQTNNHTERVFMSKSGLRNNFNISDPIEDDDAIQFDVWGPRVNPIRHFLDTERLGLVIFTGGSEYRLDGNAYGVVTPTALNLRRGSSCGASAALVPQIVGNRVLYVQARGNVVRELRFDALQGVLGTDISLPSAHLLDGFTLVRWAYAETPEYTFWTVRSDGSLVGLTYQYEQNVVAWHRHDSTNGFFEDVCTVPEGTEDAVYFVVRRVINGVTTRYIERLNTRFFTDVRDWFFLDAGKTFDGRNTGATTLELTGGSTWSYTENLTLVASAPTFSASDVRYDLWDASTSTYLRCTVIGYTDSTHVTVNANRTVPVGLQLTATASWVKCLQQLTGLSHLAGQSVSVLGDGFVVASPNNTVDNYPALVVASDGSLALPQPYGVVQVGLPILADLETLDIDTPSGSSLKDRFVQVTQSVFWVVNTRGIFAGTSAPGSRLGSVDPLDGLTEYKARAFETYDVPTTPITDAIPVQTLGAWNNNGRVFLRQVDPLAATILAAIPNGYVNPTQAGES